MKFDGNWWQYIFNKPIYPRQPLKFKLRIVKTQYASIMVGVVDYAKEGANKSSYKSGNSLTYEGYDGPLYP